MAKAQNLVVQTMLLFSWSRHNRATIYTGKSQKSTQRGGRTHNLKIRSLARYHCASRAVYRHMHLVDSLPAKAGNIDTRCAQEYGDRGGRHDDIN